MAKYIAEIILFSGPFIPEGFLPCDGRELLVRDFQALYSIIGNTYGGTEFKTFRLPDLRARTPVGYHASGVNLEDRTHKKLGESGGTEASKTELKLEVDNLPLHSHEVVSKVPVKVTVKVSEMASLSDIPSGNLLAQLPIGSAGFISTDAATGDASPKGTLAGVVVEQPVMEAASVGKGKPVEFKVPRNPYLTIRYLIAVSGDLEYPVRSDAIDM